MNEFIPDHDLELLEAHLDGMLAPEEQERLGGLRRCAPSARRGGRSSPRTNRPKRPRGRWRRACLSAFTARTAGAGRRASSAA